MSEGHVFVVQVAFAAADVEANEFEGVALLLRGEIRESTYNSKTLISRRVGSASRGISWRGGGEIASDSDDGVR